MYESEMKLVYTLRVRVTTEKLRKWERQPFHITVASTNNLGNLSSANPMASLLCIQLWNGKVQTFEIFICRAEKAGIWTERNVSLCSGCGFWSFSHHVGVLCINSSSKLQSSIIIIIVSTRTSRTINILEKENQRLMSSQR